MSILRTGATTTLWDRTRPAVVLVTAAALSVGVLSALAGTIPVGH